MFGDSDAVLAGEDARQPGQPCPAPVTLSAAELDTEAWWAAVAERLDPSRWSNRGEVDFDFEDVDFDPVHTPDPAPDADPVVAGGISGESTASVGPDVSIASGSGGDIDPHEGPDDDSEPSWLFPQPPDIASVAGMADAPSWARLAAGPPVADALVTLDPSSMTGADALECVAAADRLISWAHAQQARALAQFDAIRSEALDAELASVKRLSGLVKTGIRRNSVTDEIRARLTWSTGWADTKRFFAQELVTHPATAAALSAGIIDVAKAQTILDATALLADPKVAAHVEKHLLAKAAGWGLARLRDAARKAVIAADPAAAEDRHKKARSDRHVSYLAVEDGMARLSLLSDAVSVHRLHTTVRAHAKLLCDDDPRTLDQRCADILTDLSGLLDCLTAPGACAHGLTTHRDPADTVDSDESELTTADSDDSDLTTADPGIDNPSAAGNAGTSARAGAGEAGEGEGETAGRGGDRQDEAAGSDCGGSPDARCDDLGTDSGSPEGADGEGGSSAATYPAGTDDPLVPVPSRLARRGRVKVQIEVCVSADTLLGLNDRPGWLAGHGPLLASQARELAAGQDATWRRLLTDPESGTVLDVGATTYHPPAAMARHVTARDRRCRFPGCRRRASETDLDHTINFPQGPTAAHNLSALCRRHHNLKTHTKWRVEQRTPGCFRWTAPTGHIYITEPDDPLGDDLPPVSDSTPSPGPPPF